MAQSLDDFAKRIRERARLIDEKVNKTVAQTAGLVLATVVPATPVDTGHARANWQVSIDEPITTELVAVDRGGGVTIAKGTSEAQNRKPGQTIYICNNVPYIGALNQGSSAQAPAEFVQLAVRVAVEYIRNARVVE